MKAITREWQLYPVGVVFGLGFDTATEVALLATTALLASQHIPWYTILSLPILLTAGMTLMDTTRRNVHEPRLWLGLLQPRPEGVLHLAITGLSVAICFFIGGVEVLSLLPKEIKGLSQSHGFWGFMANFNINTAGFVIVGMFILTWLVGAACLALWPDREETGPPGSNRPQPAVSTPGWAATADEGRSRST